MSGYFPVDVRDEHGSSRVSDYRFLFKSPGPVDSADLADCIKEGLRRTLFPDALVIVCVPEETKPLLRLLKNDRDVKQSLLRASSKICVALCEITLAGELVNHRYVRNPVDSLPLMQPGEQSRIFSRGLEKLFGTPRVLVEAPAGFIFVKPSQDRSTFFLRVEETLFETERVTFLAYSLLERLAARETETGGPIETIYIDTMAIASLAYVLRELYAELFARERPNVVSFHSYSGISAIPKPRSGTSLCLVSASSSMNMQRRWKEVTNCFPSEVITLLTLASAQDSGDAVYAFNRDGLIASGAQPSGLRDLRILGERFNPEDTPLKKVLLTVRAHKNQHWAQQGPKYSSAGIFSVMNKGPRPGDKVRPLFVDGMRLMDHEPFKIFLEKEIAQRVPLTIQAIIHQDDDASEKLARKCSRLIKKKSYGLKKLSIINAKEITEKSGVINRDDALLIVAAVVGRGTQLLSLSRDLRDLHIGARRYLVGFQITETISDAKQLQSNLCFSSEKSSIELSAMEKIAVGRNVGDSYSDEIRTLNAWQKRVAFPDIKTRVVELNGQEGTISSPFLPVAWGESSKLILRKDFAYWESNYQAGAIHGPAVLMTVAAVLQHARESREFKNDDHRLSSDTFQQVVIDPENFARYNDGILQASILRAAHPCELDYSFDEDVSRRMTDFLIGIITHRGRERGEAALEFALALFNGRLKLSKSDLTRLRNKVGENLGSDSGYCELLRDLLRISSSEAWAETPPI